MDNNLLPFKRKINDELERLELEKRKLLEERPELWKLQHQLDVELAKCGEGKTEQEQHNRCVTVMSALISKFNQLKELMNKLKKEIE